ncbi:MAG: hypothetical protein GX911_05735 [Spirochaetales bacterium]|nr:hypothetical protein [Spirochaetales bacterium]
MKRVLFVVLFLSSALLLASPWKQIETVHARIIFEEEEAEAAREIASFADEVFEELAALLENPTTKRVPVILTGRTAWANGMYAPFPSSIILYLAGDEDRFLGTGTRSWLRTVYIHELTHYLHLTKAEGVYKLLRIFGPGMTSLPVPFMPGWWIEGITTYAESMDGEGGRGNSLKFSLLTQKPIDEDSMWSLAKGAYSGVFPPSGRIYATGYIMIEHLIRTYGFSAFNEINRTFVNFPFMGMNRIFKRVIGITAKELFEAAIEERIRTVPSSLGFPYAEGKGGSAFLPTRTQAGIVGVVSTPKEGTFLKEHETGKRIATLPISKASAISLGDEYALFSSRWTDSAGSDSLPLAPDGYSDLFLHRFEDGESRRLTHKQRLLHPRISKDGKRAVASLINGSFHDLVEVDLLDGSARPLLREDGASFLDSALNSDGSKIVTVKVKDGNTGLVLVDDGGGRILIGPTADELGDPVFIDDSTILFTAEGKESFGAYRLDLESGIVEELFRDENGIFALSVVDDLLLYETAVASGRAVRALEYAGLEGTEGSFSPPRAESPPKPDSSFEITPYRDALRLNLILPYPFVDGNQWHPGIFIHSSSLLRKHTLLALAGIDVEKEYPYGAFTYQYRKGRVVAETGIYVEKEYQELALQGGVTLLSFVSSKARTELNLLGGGKMQHRNAEEVSGFMNLGMGVTFQNRGGRISDFYGPSFISSTVQLQTYLQEPVITLGMANLQGQTRLGSTSLMLNASVDYFSSNHVLNEIVLPIYGFAPAYLHDRKLRFGVMLRIPLALLDLPFLYGGFTGLGLEVGARTVLYPGGNPFFEDVGFEAKLSARYALVSGADLKFFVAFHVLGSGAWNYTIGIDGLSLF